MEDRNKTGATTNAPTNDITNNAISDRRQTVTAWTAADISSIGGCRRWASDDHNYNHIRCVLFVVGVFFFVIFIDSSTTTSVANE